mgnify:FL=1
MTIKNFKRDDLNAIRAEVAAREEAKNQTNSPRKTFGDGASFPFWNQPSGTKSQVRFLPDSDPDNTLFYRERFDIKLPFDGIVGVTDKPIEVQVPCMKTWKEVCPIINETKSWWDDEDKKDLARKYYFKRKYLYQGFVVRTELEEENVPENPIRRFLFGPQIHKIIYAYINDPDLRYTPTDPENGRDFRIAREQKGTGFPDYSTSSWAADSRALNDAEIEAIEKYGLFELKEFLPKKPTSEEVSIIHKMFEASVNGEQYDPAKWGQYYKPAGFRFDNSSETKTETTSQSSTTDDVPFETEEVTKSSAAPLSALEELKRRRGLSK